MRANDEWVLGTFQGRSTICMGRTCFNHLRFSALFPVVSVPRDPFLPLPCDDQDNLSPVLGTSSSNLCFSRSKPGCRGIVQGPKQDPVICFIRKPRLLAAGRGHLVGHFWLYTILFGFLSGLVLHIKVDVAAAAWHER